MYAGQHAESKGSSIARSIVSFVIMVAIILAAFLLIRNFVVQPYEIPSSSMEKTVMTGDVLFSEKVSYYLREPERGDIITFADPAIPSRVLLKRVVAVEGETVDLVDGAVVVDGVPLDEPYTDGQPSYPLTPAYGTTIGYPYTVPAGELWVMGDNRMNSQDSRYFGSVKASTVTGRAALVYWPLGNIGLLE